MLRDCSSHSLAAKRSTMASLYWIRNGAASIDSSMEARITWVSTGSSRFSPSIWFSSTAELAGLRQAQAGAHGHALARAEGARQQRDQHELEEDGQEQQQQDQPQVIEHHAHIEQHADGDEEQAEQHVAEGLDVLFHRWR